MNNSLVKTVCLMGCMLMAAVPPGGRAATEVYDLVADFFDLGIPAGSNPAVVTQAANAVWRYQYENSPHNHDGTYASMTNGWNANYRGYGLASWRQNGAETYPAGSNLRAVVNASDNPHAIAILNPANARYLKSYAKTGVGNLWEPLVIVWTAPMAGDVVVGIAATNAALNDLSVRTTNLSLDGWDGSTLTVLDSVSLASGNSYTLSATRKVRAGEQIHIWRDAFVNQQGDIAFSGTISLTPIPMETLITIR